MRNWVYVYGSVTAASDLAIAAAKELTSAATESLRAVQAGSVPTRSLLQERTDLMQSTPFHDLLAKQVMTGVVARPSVLAGTSYNAVLKPALPLSTRL